MGGHHAVELGLGLRTGKLEGLLVLATQRGGTLLHLMGKLVVAHLANDALVIALIEGKLEGLLVLATQRGGTLLHLMGKLVVAHLANDALVIALIEIDDRPALGARDLVHMRSSLRRSYALLAPPQRPGAPYARRCIFLTVRLYPPVRTKGRAGRSRPAERDATPATTQDAGRDFHSYSRLSSMTISFS